MHSVLQRSGVASPENRLAVWEVKPARTELCGKACGSGGSSLLAPALAGCCVAVAWRSAGLPWTCKAQPCECLQLLLHLS